MKRLSLIFLVGACGHKDPTGDCAVVAKDPAGAMKALSTTYPGDPVRVAETIEKCIAPTGDACERIVKIVQAIPGMMGASKQLNADSLLTTCNGMPDQMKHCLLPSYSLAHTEECKNVYAHLADSVAEINIPLKSKRCEGGVVSAMITTEGVWIGATDGKGCFGKRAGTELDTTWLEAALRSYVGDCPPVVEIAASRETPYRELIAVMDFSIKVGLIDTSLARPDDLTHAPGSAPESAPARCEKVTATGATHGTPPTSPPPGKDLTGTLRTTESGELAKLPVIVVTKSELSYQDKPVGDIAEIAKGTGDIAALASVLPAKPSDNRIILQADEATPSSAIMRIANTAKNAGYENVLFVVKNK